MNWQTVSLAEVAEIERNGIDPSSIDPDTNYLGLEHIENGGRIIGFQKVKNGELASTKFQFGPNHVLYGKLRPYLAKIALPDFEGICSTDILPIRPGPKLDKAFLAYYLRQPNMVEFASSRSSGANLPRLSPKALSEFELPLPPLNEQKRIAAILDQADELRRLRQTAIAKLNTLGQSIFYEMFGDPQSNTKHIKTVSLGDLIKVNSGGGLTSGKMRPGDFPVYGGNGINGWHDETNVEQGTIVIGRVGVYCGSIHVTKSKAWVTDNALIVRKKVEVETNYLASALKIAHLNQYAGRSSQPLVSGARIYPVQIIFPPLAQQKEFSKKLAEVQLHQFQLTATHDHISRLFSSLQQCAFRGEL